MTIIEDAPRPASSAGARAARTGLLAVLLMPLSLYRITPLFVWLLGTPPGPASDGLAEVLAPAITGALLGGIGAAGVALRDYVAAKPQSPWYVRLGAWGL